MTDYTSMTNDQINRAVADCLGFEVIQVTNRFGDWWALRDGQGTYYDDGVDNYYPQNRRTKEQAWDDMPDWAGSLDVATGLIYSQGMAFSLDYHPAPHTWFAAVWKTALDKTTVECTHNPARAVCEAWLKWKDSE